MKTAASAQSRSRGANQPQSKSLSVVGGRHEQGTGSVQIWIEIHLQIFPDGCTIAEMAFAFCAENDIKRSLRRSARHSLTRALRGLVKAGTVKRLHPRVSLYFASPSRPRSSPMPTNSIPPTMKAAMRLSLGPANCRLVWSQ